MVSLCTDKSVEKTSWGIMTVTEQKGKHVGTELWPGGSREITVGRMNVTEGSASVKCKSSVVRGKAAKPAGNELGQEGVGRWVSAVVYTSDNNHSRAWEDGLVGTRVQIPSTHAK